MRSRRTRIKLAAAVATLVAAGTFSIAPASADCIYAEAYYRAPGGTNQYVYGPKQCVSQTPFPPAASQSVEKESAGYTVGAKVWVTAP